jgi:hypothetical protein
VRNAGSEEFADFLENRQSATIFHDIVQQSGNRKIFVATRIENQARDPEQMRDVRDRRPLLYLFRVRARSEE